MPDRPSDVHDAGEVFSACLVAGRDPRPANITQNSSTTVRQTINFLFEKLTQYRRELFAIPRRPRVVTVRYPLTLLEMVQCPP